MYHLKLQHYPFSHWFSGWGSDNHPFRGCGWVVRDTPLIRSITTTSHLTVTIAAGADAFGHDTAASISADVRMFDRGLASFVSGSVTASALASGAANFASAYAVVDIDGGDLGFIDTQETANPDGSSMSVTSSFAAIDFKFDLPGTYGGIDVDSTVTAAGLSAVLDGNIADFHVNAVAAGPNSYVDLVADAIAVQDALTSATIAATVAVSGTVSYKLISGGTSNDRLIGMAGDDLAFGGRGNDVVLGLQGNDWLFGEQGADRLEGDAGNDTLFGNNGKDILHGGAGDDWMFGGDDADEIDGGINSDLLYGGEGSDLLRGGAGNDYLVGGDGRDRIFGDAGNDTFRLGDRGGDDDDLYTGGLGADTYLIDERFDDDVITDFLLKDGDHIVLGEDVDHWCVSLRLASCDADDLEVVFSGRESGGSTLVLDEFLSLNPGSLGHTKRLTEMQAGVILHNIFSDAPGDSTDVEIFIFGDLLITLN
ncbi:calcium-binding protein [Rhizobium deserti]|uniref:Calcium-binding protein n=1 Tax=Rhizobium deserti TaxID=2547961 RepID=A0A4R5U6E9_9HYPH|nr:calcium-binding protein [Rhizobium deserti]TDK29677.1 calcium-binding protein [Rhizobium deserti]